MHSVSDNSNLQQFEAGTLLIEEGESSRKMFIIRSGRARVYKTYMHQRVTLAVLAEGEVFGELSFFDAEKRSASVEALTPLSALVFDGEAAAREIQGMPAWIFPILRTTFQRFREADRKIMILQSMHEYRKKAFKTDHMGKTIYLELLRFLKAFFMLRENLEKKSAVLDARLFYRELDELLGERRIGLGVFWKLLKEHHFIDHQKEELDNRVVPNETALEAWKEYLISETQKERYMLLSHTAVAILARLVGFLQEKAEASESASEQASSEHASSLKLDTDAIKISALPYFEPSLKELVEHKIVEVKENQISVIHPEIAQLYVYQDILKSFDHMSMRID